MAKFSCEIKKLLVLGADPSFLLKKTCTYLFSILLQDLSIPFLKKIVDIHLTRIGRFSLDDIS